MYFVLLFRLLFFSLFDVEIELISLGWGLYKKLRESEIPFFPEAVAIAGSVLVKGSSVVGVGNFPVGGDSIEVDSTESGLPKVVPEHPSDGSGSTLVPSVKSVESKNSRFSTELASKVISGTSSVSRMSTRLPSNPALDDLILNTSIWGFL